MPNKSYISKLFLAIIPVILLIGYFERYLNLLPQYFVTAQVYSKESVVHSGNVELETFTPISLSLIDTISAINVPNWKVERIKNYYDSVGAPLASKSRFLVQAATYYRIDYNLVSAISIIESSGGKNTYRPYNAWGWGGSSRAFVFSSWEEAIVTVSRGLSGYYAGGANTPARIAPRYNPVTPNEWSRKVAYVMEQM